MMISFTAACCRFINYVISFLTESSNFLKIYYNLWFFMNRNLLNVAVLSIVVLAGCATRQAFYVSPYNSNHNPYHTIPLSHDPVTSASYASLSISNGTANDRQADQTLTFFASLSRAHNFGNFQGFYAANLSLGNYKVAPFSEYESTGGFYPEAINKNAGNKFFGSTGIDGGVNVVLPIHNGEWRVLGIETSVQQEFGSYASFRQKLTDKDADFIVRSKLFATLGGYTELVKKISNGSKGVRLAAGSALASRYHNVPVIVRSSGKRLVYNYISFTFFVTKKKVTGYLQANYSGKCQAAFLGVNYRLGKVK